jgi:SPP1 family predicted phage head-tail adaptor
MRIGTLRHRVRIERGEAAQDGLGAEVLTWREVATVWAEVRSVSGREQTEMGEQIFGLLTHQVWMRYRTGITPKMRLVWNGRVLEIQSVHEVDNRMRSLRLMCLEVLR